MIDLLKPTPMLMDDRLTQLAAENDRLEMEVRLRDRYLAFVTHELRTPLTPIVMLSEMLAAQDELDDDTRDAAAQIHGNALLATRLIADLLDLSRLNYGKLQYRMEPLDIHEIIMHAESAVSFDASDRSIALTMNLAATAHVVYGDVDRLTQALLNLLTNGVKFTGDCGSVSVRTWDIDAGRIGIAVGDTGIGIDPERLPHLFDPFYQAPEERSARKHGLGLGLAISKMLIEAHGGSLTVHSDGVGAGSTFEVVLPVSSANPS